MTERALSGIIISFLSLVLMSIGIKGYKSEKPMGFWANTREVPDIEDISGYNKATGKLFIGFGIMLMLSGLLLFGLGDIGYIAFMLILPFMVIVMAAVYTQKIEARYRKRR